MASQEYNIPWLQIDFTPFFDLSGKEKSKIEYGADHNEQTEQRSAVRSAWINKVVSSLQDFIYRSASREIRPIFVGNQSKKNINFELNSRDMG